MSEYKNILVALECSKESEAVLERAKQLADLQGSATLHLLHVVIDIIAVDWVGMPGQVPPPIDQSELTDSAAQYLKPMIEKVGLDPSTLTMRYGFAAQEILDQITWVYFLVNVFCFDHLLYFRDIKMLPLERHNNFLFKEVLQAYVSKRFELSKKISLSQLAII